MKIKILIKEVSLEAELSETSAAKAIVAALPICAELNEWGDEFYFEIPVVMPLDETATLKVSVGDIGYWPPGNALTIFFGPTPMSKGPEPRPASPVNIVGKITGDATLLRRAKGATKVRIETVSEGK
ncbi:MAG: cyclophilin-like fold protein [Dissulfurispiraceae bacterium]